MHNKIKQRQSLLEDMTLNQPLMTYAAHNLFYHIGKAGRDDGRLFAALDAYLVPEKPAFAILMMMTFRGMGLYGRRSRPCKSFTTMHLSASEGMTQYFRHISQVAGAKLDQPEQKMLGPDVIVIEPIRFLACQSENLLCPRSKIIHYYWTRKESRCRAPAPLYPYQVSETVSNDRGLFRPAGSPALRH